MQETRFSSDTKTEHITDVFIDRCTMMTYKCVILYNWASSQKMILVGVSMFIGTNVFVSLVIVTDEDGLLYVKLCTIIAL